MSGRHVALPASIDYNESEQRQSSTIDDKHSNGKTHVAPVLRRCAADTRHGEDNTLLSNRFAAEECECSSCHLCVGKDENCHSATTKNSPRERRTRGFAEITTATGTGTDSARIDGWRSNKSAPTTIQAPLHQSQQYDLGE